MNRTPSAQHTGARRVSQNPGTGDNLSLGRTDFELDERLPTDPFAIQAFQLVGLRLFYQAEATHRCSNYG